MYRPSNFDLIKQRYEEAAKRILTDEQQENLALIIKIVREVDRKTGTGHQSFKI